MTGQTVLVLTCDRETRSPLDGMRTICGEQLEGSTSVDALRDEARRRGWAHRGQQDYCPEHMRSSVTP